MRESCYCGRTGQVSDRRPVVTEGGERALACPDCGHLEYLEWLPEDARRDVFRTAESGQPTAA